MKNSPWKKPLAVIVAGVVAAGGVSYALTHHHSAQGAGSSVTIPNPPISSLDPTNWGGQILIDQGTVLEGLYGYNGKNQIVPKIATGYEVSNDGKTWTITLRKDARWSNGDPVTAHDFYYAWMRLISPSDTTGAIWASVMQNVKNAYEYHSGAAKASQVGLKVLGDYKLQITLTQPHDILGELVLSGSMPLNAKSIEAHPTDWWLPQNFVGDGPYIVKSFTPNGTISLVRNPKYVGAKGQKNVGNVQQINLIPTPTVPVEDYMAGKMDVALITNISDLQYVNRHGLKSQLIKQPSNSVTYLQYDNAVAASPLDNLKVRQAIAEALNRAPIVHSVLSGMGGVANAFGSPTWPAVKYEKDLSYDVSNARRLLAEAGYPDGKGMPTLYLYCQTQTNNPQSIPVAEAIAQELKRALNLHFKIVPEAATIWGGITWGGMNKGIQPGYNIATGVANWSEPGNDDMQGAQSVLYAGTYGYSPAFRQAVYPWYINQYNPADVQAYGDPNNPKLGVSWSDWTKLQQDAYKDIQWLNAWYKSQPQPYQSEVTPTIPLMQQWNTLVDAWKSATNPTAKHLAWVSAWKFVGTYSTGAGNATLGLNAQVYWDQNQSATTHEWRMLQTEMENAVQDTKAQRLAGKLTTDLMQQGYSIPLYYNVNFVLVKPYVKGVQTNPWSWGNFYQLQYLELKH